MNDTLSPYETAIMALLDDIAGSLRTLAASAPQTTPDYQRRLEEYAGFDWQAIGAVVLDTDNDGPSAVEWRGRRYTRRAPQNKFDAAIWFSRAAGKDEDGTVHYERLITFKVQAEPEPLPAKAKQALAAVAPVQNGNGHGQKVAAMTTPAPPAEPKAVASAPVPATPQPAPRKVSIIRTLPLDPAQLKAWIVQEAGYLADHGRTASKTQVGATHNALAKLVPEEATRHVFQAWLTGNASMSDWPLSLVLAVHNWLKPAAGNGPTDGWCRDEVALALDLLRPVSQPVAVHPVWETKEDAAEWAFRQGVFPDAATALASLTVQWNAWGKPEKGALFDKWEHHVAEMRQRMEMVSQS